MNICLADDDLIIRRGIEVFLSNEQHCITCFNNGKDALAGCLINKFDLIISDMMMPEMTGIELLTKLKDNNITVPVILITAYASVEDAVYAMKIGAEDYLTKPLNLEELKLKVNKIRNKNELLKENTELRKKLSLIEFPEIMGCSKAIEELKNKILKVAADPDVTVMIYGESGTGKELAARSIHSKSNRSNKQFIAVNCAALSEELLESELFGHVKGAFTNALRDKDGLFKAADKGTLFLDEVSEMSPRLQAKLLRVLQERQFQPVGSAQTLNIDVRIVGASNKDLLKLIKDGKFREDLYYRLNVIEILLLPLRERPEDIPFLVDYFLLQHNQKAARQICFSPDVIEILQKYAWPGNIRELKNFIRMISVTIEKEKVELSDLPETIFANAIISSLRWKNLWQLGNFQRALSSAVENFECEYLNYHIKKNNGNISKTAAAIGLSRVSLYKKINQYNLSFEEKDVNRN